VYILGCVDGGIGGTVHVYANDALSGVVDVLLKSKYGRAIVVNGGSA
jgi:hypothetical protein